MGFFNMLIANTQTYQNMELIHYIVFNFIIHLLTPCHLFCVVSTDNLIFLYIMPLILPLIF